MYRRPHQCGRIPALLLCLLLTVLAAAPAVAQKAAGDEDPAKIRLGIAESILAESLGTPPDQLRSSWRGRDSTLDNLDLFFYSAGAAELDLGTAWVVLDRAGNKVDLNAIEADEGRELFPAARAMLEKPSANGCSTIYGFKWNDLNGNGVHDNGEPLLANWDIILTNQSLQQSYLVTTGSNGHYFVTGLPAGTYIVSEAADMDWIQTYPPSGHHLITLGVCDAAEANFGNSYLGPCHLGCSVEVDCPGGPSGPGEATCHATPSGVPPFQYQWQVQGPVIDLTILGPSILFWCPLGNPNTPDPIITATVTMTDACGCVATDWDGFTCRGGGVN